MLISLQDIRDHLRLDDTAQDNQLEGFYSAAVDYCENFVGYSLTDSSSSQPTLNPAIRAAILLIIGDLYENREAVPSGGQYNPNLTVERLLHFHRKGLGI